MSDTGRTKRMVGAQLVLRRKTPNSSIFDLKIFGQGVHQKDSIIMIREIREGSRILFGGHLGQVPPGRRWRRLRVSSGPTVHRRYVFVLPVSDIYTAHVINTYASGQRSSLRSTLRPGGHHGLVANPSSRSRFVPGHTTRREQRVKTKKARIWGF